VDSKPNRGSHLPILMRLVPKTTGPILELGSGMYSTPYLHWACFPTRKLVTYESSPHWFDVCANQFMADFHTIKLALSLREVDFSSPWSIALVDHDWALNTRGDSVRRLVHAEYVVAHDSEGRRGKRHGYWSVAELFKFRCQFKSASHSHTMILSNIHDLSVVAPDSELKEGWRIA
jgi:hypothetical protein